jgi:hypothetical protein
VTWLPFLEFENREDATALRILLAVTSMTTSFFSYRKMSYLCLEVMNVWIRALEDGTRLSDLNFETVLQLVLAALVVNLYDVKR